MEPNNRELVRLRLEDLTAKNGGRLTPEDVVADAKKKDSPLHEMFEWDTKKAAHLHWLDTARQIIRSVRVTVRTESAIVSTVAYVRDPELPPDQQGYRSVVALRTEKDKARDAVVQEFQRAGSVLRRARELAQVLELAGEVEEIIDSVDDLKERALKAA